MSSDIKTPVPSSQILSLIQLSSSCSQSFTYNCYLAPLSIDESDYAYWTDRHGGINNYFTGYKNLRILKVFMSFFQAHSLAIMSVIAIFQMRDASKKKPGIIRATVMQIAYQSTFKIQV